MSITRTVVRRPTTIFIVFVLIIGLGIYSASDLAIDLYPEIEPPILLVTTDYSGAGPEEVENSVTRPLESTLSNVSNVEDISSTSSKGNSMVMLEFSYGTNMAEASNSVRDNLEFAGDMLPDDADSPMIFKFDPSMIPIMGISVSGQRTPEELRQIAEDTVQPRLEQVEGVALASVSGGRTEVVRVEISQNRLEAYDLTLTQVSGMLRGQNVQITGGSISEGPKNYLVLTSGRYDSVEEIKDTAISYRGGKPDRSGEVSRLKTVRLRDVAEVYEGYRDPNTLVYINGEPGVQLVVQKQSGTNSVQTAENVRERMDRIRGEVPRGVVLNEIFNTTDIIETSLTQVGSSAILGALFAVIVLLVFLRSLKSTFIIGLTIPISLVITLLFMYFAGLTLNIMTLAGLALGVGMLVDNSIVILENIYRYREKGAKLTASAILGTQEMINAIVASTLTTICVFGPVALFKDQLDITGELLASLSFTVVISLTSSLAVAMLLIPVLSSHYLPLSSRRQRPLRGVLRFFDDRVSSFFTGLENVYKWLLVRALNHKIVTILIILALMGGSAYTVKDAGFEFLPGIQEDSVQVNVEMPIGTRLDRTEDVLKQMERIIEDEVPSHQNLIMQVGERSLFGFLGSADSHKGNIRVELPPLAERDSNTDEIKQRLRGYFNDFPGAVFSFGGTQGAGIGGGSPIDIMVKTPDLDKGKDIAERIQELIAENVPEATEPTVDLSDGLPQVEISIDRDKLYSYGLDINTVGREIQANIDGITAGRYQSGSTEHDILVLLEEEDRTKIPDLDRIFVMNNSDQRVPLSSIAGYERTTGPTSINRENQTRVIHVTAGTEPGAALSDVEMKVRNVIDEGIPAEEDVIIEFSGEYQDLVTYGTRFVYILLVSVFLVFGVMASQFESFLDPFIILFTVPLSLIGVILLYTATGETYSLLTAVGLVMLAGIIVNNGIVLVDYTNLLRKRGRSIREACIEGGGNRLRPILMTSLTTILALLPMSFFAGEGSELVAPIGKSVVGGLSVGALLTLFFIPVIYAIFNRLSEKRMQRKELKKQKRREKRKQILAERENEQEGKNKKRARKAGRSDDQQIKQPEDDEKPGESE
ncbi:MAG: efflux RND transporter permease subunit [Spirochaetia bacterium]